MASQTIEQFYQDFETLPKLISTLALSIADAQARMDEGYLQSLAKLAQIAGELKGQGVDLGTAGFTQLFKDMGPSRYQFTETVVDVRADLRMSTGNEFSVGGSLGLKTPMFAVAVNASYLQRTAADFQASALIHCVINAVSSDASVMQKLLDAAPKLDPGTLKQNDSGYPILDGWRHVLGVGSLVINADVLTGKAGTTLNTQLTAAGAITGQAHFTMTPSQTAGGGVKLSDAGLLSGDLGPAGDYPVTITVKDDAAPPLTGTRQYTIKVTP